MTFILLTGAGFSRNWGGWLADEAFEYLIGCPEIDVHLRHLLWQSKRKAANSKTPWQNFRKSTISGKTPNRRNRFGTWKRRSSVCSTR